MKRILFIETPVFTGATRVTWTIAKKIKGHFETRTTVIEDTKNIRQDIQEVIEKEQPDILFSSLPS